MTLMICDARNMFEESHENERKVEEAFIKASAPVPSQEAHTHGEVDDDYDYRVHTITEDEIQGFCYGKCISKCVTPSYDDPKIVDPCAEKCKKECITYSLGG
ncbi:hypothetical protein RJT34_29213 [Clitoria ternatea]|uniref:Uncharacterized protein n=1 Tax=Clitoria ternatea TaxID=43366 RepID=A0AAN9FAB1_CLITE